MSLSSKQKYITIATDISCDSTFKISTWACYIRYNGGVIKRVEQFKQYHKHTGDAETYALINALSIAYLTIPDWDVSKIIIHNEIEFVLNPLRTKAGNIKKHDETRSQAILNIGLPLLDKAQGWDRRKIKAHFKDWQTSDNPAKYAMNRWCDMESRRLLKETRRKIKKERRK